MYKTTTDQNVSTTQHDIIHYWDVPCRPLNLIENFTESGVSVRKKNGLLTFHPKSLYDYMVEFM